MQKFFKNKFILLVIILVAIIFRFTGVNWDENMHLHPDERFMTMVGLDMKFPTSLSVYLDPTISPLRPYNIKDAAGNRKYPFYVYGTFPLTINKLLAVVTANDTYNGFTILGRMISAFMDVLVVLLIYRMVQLLEKSYHLHHSLKLWAAFFYAIAVLPIQLSHFYAVDTFLNTFIFASLYFSVTYYEKKTTDALVLSAVFFGLASASKITSIFLLPLIVFFIISKHLIFLRHFKLKEIKQHKHEFIRIFGLGVLFGIISYTTLRLADPYIFETSSFLNPKMSTTFLQSLQQLEVWSSKDAWFPPAVQWLHKPAISFSLISIALFGVGLPYFVLILAGIYASIKKRNWPFLMFALWCFIFFLYQSTQFTKTIRYFINLYPFFAIFAAMAWSYFLQKKSHLLQIIIFIMVIIWPLSFLSIYIKPNSRVQASAWIYQNIPSGSTIAWELWDDPLPLRLQQYSTISYNLSQLNVFDPDTPEKWTKMTDQLQHADYYILSSNRAWGSIPTAPERYPKMTVFYKNLFANRLQFKKIKKFSSYPSLSYLGIPITFPDDFAEESFTVYDHPEVYIFKRE